MKKKKNEGIHSYFLLLVFCFVLIFAVGCNKNENKKYQEKEQTIENVINSEAADSGGRNYLVGFAAHDEDNNRIRNEQEIELKKYYFDVTNLSNESVEYLIFATVDGIMQTEIVYGKLEKNNYEPVELDFSKIKGVDNNKEEHTVRIHTEFFSEGMTPKHEKDYFPSGGTTAFYYTEIPEQDCTLEYEFDEFVSDEYTIGKRNCWFSNEQKDSYRAIICGEKVFLHINCPAGIYSYHIYADGKFLYEGFFENKEEGTIIRDITDLVRDAKVIWADGNNLEDGEIYFLSNFYLIE